MMHNSHLICFIILYLVLVRLHLPRPFLPFGHVIAWNKKVPYSLHAVRDEFIKSRGSTLLELAYSPEPLLS